MKNLLILFLTFIFISNVNGQDIYAETADGLIDKDYDTFAFLNMGDESDRMAQQENRMGQMDDQNRNTGETGQDRRMGQMDDQDKMDHKGNKEEKSWSSGQQDERIKQGDKTQEYFSAILIYTDPEFPDWQTKRTVKHAIKHELISEGYEMDEENPDFLVSYLVFNKDGKLKGDFVEDDENLAATTIDTPEEFDVSEGTLLVSVIDRETGETVWSGFNDGAFKDNQNIEEADAIRAVSNVLDRMSLDDFPTR